MKKLEEMLWTLSDSIAEALWETKQNQFYIINELISDSEIK